MVFVATDNAQIRANVQLNTIVQTFAPPANFIGSAGQFWIDRSTTPPTVYQFDTKEWNVIESTAGGVLPVAQGGTGDSTLTAHSVLIGEGTSPVAFAGPGATSGVPLIAQGASADPVFGTAVVAGGGTGAVTLTAHGVLVGEGTSPVAATAAGSAGQLLTSGGASADPAWTTATFPATATAGALIAATATNVIGQIVDVAVGQVLASGGVGVIPAYTGSPSVSGSLTAATTVTATLGAITATNGNLVMGTLGNKVIVPVGTNGSAGTSGVMAGTPGAVTVATTACSATAKVFYCRNVTGGTMGNVSITAQDGTGFTLTSTGNETSTFNWWIINA